MRQPRLFALGVILVACTPAQAAEPNILDGNRLLEACEEAYVGLCNGYILAASEFLSHNIGVAKEQYQICLQDGTTARQLIDVVLLRLRSRPQDRTLGASQLVASALMEAWPCKQQN